MKNFVLIGLALGLVGCGYISKREVEFSVRGTIPQGSRIAVIVPQDGAYGSEQYPNSGRMVANQLVAVLSRYYPGSEALSSGGSNWKYVARPALLHWEERATEWSGKPDKIEVAIPVYSGDRLVSSAIIKGSSSWWTLGGDHPEDLFKLPSEIYAVRLAGIDKTDTFVKVK